jgi:hypothetical protein
MNSNGTYESTLFDATSQVGLTNTQIIYEYDATHGYLNVTRRIGDYFVASNYLYTDSVNNVSQAGIITLFKLDYSLNSIFGY